MLACPELPGDDADIDAFSPKLRGVGMPQTVGVDPLFDFGPGRETLEQPPYIGVRDIGAPQRAEDGDRAVEAEVATRVEPQPDYRRGALVESDRAGAVALAVQHTYGAGIEVEVLRIQVQRLVDPQAASIEQGDQRAGRSGRGRRTRPSIAAPRRR